MAFGRNDSTQGMAEPEQQSTEVAPFDFASLPIGQPDPQAIARELFRRVLEAPDLDAALDVLEGKTSRDYIGQVFTFSDVELSWYQPQDRNEPIPAAKAKAVNADGEVIDFWTSSLLCVALLAKAMISGALPVTLRLVERRTGTGRDAFNFERA